LRYQLVDNSDVTTTRAKPIPLPCALLALSVVMVIGSAGAVEASTVRGTATTQADQRETIEHLLGAIQQAAKKLTDQMTGQAAMLERRGAAAAAEPVILPTAVASDDTLTVSFLRESLLNLPPPTR